MALKSRFTFGEENPCDLEPWDIESTAGNRNKYFFLLGLQDLDLRSQLCENATPLIQERELSFVHA